jgi:hypothetical protein
MTSPELLDATGRRRSPATTLDHHYGRPPRNKGLRYPPDPPSVEEIVTVMRCAGETAYGLRARALMVVLWRSGLRISEALALAESDLDMSRGAVLVRRGKGGKRREVGMDTWAWQHLERWLAIRVQLPIGALLCVINGPTAGRPWAASAARTSLRRLAVPLASAATLRPTNYATPTPLKWRASGVPLNVIQRQLGHTNLGVTSIYLQGIDNSEIIETVHARPAPTLPASAGLGVQPPMAAAPRLRAPRTLKRKRDEATHVPATVRRCLEYLEWCIHAKAQAPSALRGRASRTCGPGGHRPPLSRGGWSTYQWGYFITWQRRGALVRTRPCSTAWPGLASASAGSA